MSFTTNSTLQTIQLNVVLDQILDLHPIGGSKKLSANTTCISSLNVSWIAILSNNVVIGGSNANNILHVGNAGRSKIGSGSNGN